MIKRSEKSDEEGHSSEGGIDEVYDDDESDELEDESIPIQYAKEEVGEKALLKP